MVLDELRNKFMNIFRNDTTLPENERYISFIKTLRECDIPTTDIITKIKNRPKNVNWRNIAITELYNQFTKVKFTRQLSLKGINIILFIGLQGSGKTTTIAKYALCHESNIPRKDIGVIAADTFRAGAIDQLLQNCKLVGIDCYYNRDIFDPVSIIKAGIKHLISLGKKLILIDTSGRNYQDTALFTELKQMKTYIKSMRIKDISCIVKTIFIADATNGNVLYDHISSFKHHIGIDELIITKIDGLPKNNVIQSSGKILSIASKSKIPITYICNGEHISIKNIIQFDSKSYIQSIFGVDMTTIIKNNNIQSKIQEGKNSLYDLSVMSQQILNYQTMLGPLLSNMGNIGKMFGIDTEDIKQTDPFKFANSIIHLCKSLTIEELNNPKFRDYIEQSSRIRRFAIGVGMQEKNIIDILQEYNKMSGMFRSMNIFKQMSALKNKTISNL